MLEILRTTQPPEARVPLEAVAKTLQVELATVSELTAYLADLGLVTKASDDLVWAPAQKSRPDAGHEQLQRGKSSDCHCDS
jgi:DNA-binding IclR family transcriptional regulator